MNHEAILAIFGAACIFISATALFVDAAFGHKFPMENGQIADASWIRTHPVHYVCCGEKDCFPAKPGQIKFTAKGWKVEGTRGYIPIKEVRRIPQNVLERNGPGRNGPWYCIYPLSEYSEATIPMIRCLFLPKPRI